MHAKYYTCDASRQVRLYIEVYSPRPFASSTTSSLTFSLVWFWSVHNCLWENITYHKSLEQLILWRHLLACHWNYVIAPPVTSPEPANTATKVRDCLFVIDSLAAVHHHIRYNSSVSTDCKPASSWGSPFERALVALKYVSRFHKTLHKIVKPLNKIDFTENQF